MKDSIDSIVRVVGGYQPCLLNVSLYKRSLDSYFFLYSYLSILWIALTPYDGVQVLVEMIVPRGRCTEVTGNYRL